MRRMLVVSALALLSGCTTSGAVAPGYKLDTNAAPECRSHCQALGMELGAMVIIANSTGCVCQPPGKPMSDAGGSSAVAGGAAIVMQQENQQQQSRASK